MSGISYYLDQFNKLPPEMLLAGFVFLLFYFLRGWEKCPNELIKPLLMVLGGVLYIGMSYGLTLMFIKGSVLCGLFLLFHRYILCHCEKVLMGVLSPKLPATAVPKVAKVLGTDDKSGYVCRKPDQRKRKPKP